MLNKSVKHTTITNYKSKILVFLTSHDHHVSTI